MNSYIVAIGDIEGSKKLDLKKRKQTQSSLETVFQKLNREADSIISPYTITLGDEFQVVYHKADDLFKHIWAIMTAIHPVNVRISIGVGEITTKINKDYAMGMDGSAFHKARKNIEKMRKEKLLFSVSTDDKRFDRLINSTFRIIGANIRKWNKNRFSILHKYYEGKEVKQIAGEVGLSEVSVYKNIHAGTLDAILDLTDSISESINDML
ncbi:MAG: SatD family protein [Balneolaceae bacterium]